MKIHVLTNSDSLSFATINKLAEQNLLKGISLTKKAKPYLYDPLINFGFNSHDINILQRSTWVEVLSQYLNEHEIDMVWVLTFPWIIPKSLLSIPERGFVNFHFGLLPKYKGADPVFWQLKNQEKAGGLTIHLMNEHVDEGPVFLRKEMRIVPGENYGLHCRRLGEFLLESMDEVLEVLEDADPKFIELEAESSDYEAKPSEGDLTIDWENQSAEQIEWLVNASNPKYRGAETRCAGYVIRILEVTPVNMEQAVEAKPGQIVHADSIYGLVVACRFDEFIRITVVETAEGFHSGVKLFNLGFGVGHVFV